MKEYLFEWINQLFKVYYVSFTLHHISVITAPEYRKNANLPYLWACSSWIPDFSISSSFRQIYFLLVLLVSTGIKLKKGKHIIWNKIKNYLWISFKEHRMLFSQKFICHLPLLPGVFAQIQTFFGDLT